MSTGIGNGAGLSLLLGQVGAPASGTWAAGAMVTDTTGKAWVCTAAGTPGTWVQVGGGGAAAPLTLTAPTATSVPLTLVGAASQTADLLDVEASGGNILFSVGATGIVATNAAGSNTSVGIGSSALAGVGGTYSGQTVVGFSALYHGGNYCTAVGFSAMGNASGSSNSTAIGAGAMNSGGNNSTAVGYFALHGGGSSGTAVGYYALYSNTGASNTALGFQAGYTSVAGNANTTGTLNTFIGYNAGPGTSTQLTNATAIGAQAVVSSNNLIVLGALSGVNGATATTNTQASGWLAAAGLFSTADPTATSGQTGIGVTTGTGNGTATNLTALAQGTGSGPASMAANTWIRATVGTATGWIPFFV
jgi:hypothetical protein